MPDTGAHTGVLGSRPRGYIVHIPSQTPPLNASRRESQDQHEVWLKPTSHPLTIYFPHIVVAPAYTSSEYAPAWSTLVNGHTSHGPPDELSPADSSSHDPVFGRNELSRRRRSSTNLLGTHYSLNTPVDGSTRDVNETTPPPSATSDPRPEDQYVFERTSDRRSRAPLIPIGLSQPSEDFPRVNGDNNYRPLGRYHPFNYRGRQARNSQTSTTPPDVPDREAPSPVNGYFGSPDRLRGSFGAANGGSSRLTVNGESLQPYRHSLRELPVSQLDGAPPPRNENVPMYGPPTLTEYLAMTGQATVSSPVLSEGPLAPPPSTSLGPTHPTAPQGSMNDGQRRPRQHGRSRLGTMSALDNTYNQIQSSLLDSALADHLQDSVFAPSPSDGLPGEEFGYATTYTNEAAHRRESDMSHLDQLPPPVLTDGAPLEHDVIYEDGETATESPNRESRPVVRLPSAQAEAAAQRSRWIGYGPSEESARHGRPAEDSLGTDDPDRGRRLSRLRRVVTRSRPVSPFVNAVMAEPDVIDWALVNGLRMVGNIPGAVCFSRLPDDSPTRDPSRSQTPPLPARPLGPRQTRESIETNPEIRSPPLLNNNETPLRYVSPLRPSDPSGLRLSEESRNTEIFLHTSNSSSEANSAQPVPRYPPGLPLQAAGPEQNAWIPEGVPGPSRLPPPTNVGRDELAPREGLDRHICINGVSYDRGLVGLGLQVVMFSGETYLIPREGAVELERHRGERRPGFGGMADGERQHGPGTPSNVRRPLTAENLNAIPPLNTAERGYEHLSTQPPSPPVNGRVTAEEHAIATG